MYTQAAIDALVSRVGWAPLAQPTDKVLSTQNAESTSGRLFNSYHAMCIAENVEACMPASNASPTLHTIDNAVLNAKLLEFKTQNALKVLSAVYESEQANYLTNSLGVRVDISGTDYTSIVISRASLFDCAVGYQMAYDVLEMMLTTSRSNFRERAAADRGSLLVAQQGYRDAEGNQISDGILQRLNTCLAKITGVLFPAEVKGKNILRNASYKW